MVLPETLVKNGNAREACTEKQRHTDWYKNNGQKRLVEKGKGRDCGAES
jgi:hypothetical protein